MKKIEMARGVILAQRELLAQSFKDLGITHVRLGRGMSSPPNSIKKKMLPNKDAHYEGVMMQPAASWTDSASLARNWGGGEYVLMADVPVDRIMGYKHMGYGRSNEDEWVVIDGGLTLTMFAKHPGKDY